MEEPDGNRPVDHRRALGGVQGLPGQAGRRAGPAGAEEQVNMEALRDLADGFNVHDPRKLYRLARQRDMDVTQAMAFEALRAGRRRRPGHVRWASRLPRRLQADLIDFSQNTRGKTKYGLVVMDVFTREAAVEPLQSKSAEAVGQATKRATRGRGAQLRGHDRPGQRVCHAGPGAAHGGGAPHQAARGPQRHGRGVATRVARRGGQWSDHFEQAAGAYNARPHETVYPRTWSGSRPPSSGCCRTTPTSSSTTRI